MVYSPYEHRVLAELGRDFPKYENALAGLRGRLFDLLPVIRSSYTHPAMPNNSLKSVPPVLVPGGGYTGLEVQDGSAVSASCTTMIAEDTPEGEKDSIRDALLAYCRMDTEGLVRV